LTSSSKPTYKRTALPFFLDEEVVIMTRFEMDLRYGGELFADVRKELRERRRTAAFE